MYQPCRQQGFCRACTAKTGTDIESSNRVNRGGSWNNNAANCRVSYRNNNTPGNRNNNIGFRLACSSKHEHDFEQMPVPSSRKEVKTTHPLRSVAKRSKHGEDFVNLPEKKLWFGRTFC
ncbi:MAG: SUMF1/EgtB/PvdO family nonheme iron enzyme [Bacteroidales bacterium]|nr:SUMF1/EgtB/PvdO family nonheme iron enzyme [Bacteroidales bacterium]